MEKEILEMQKKKFLAAAKHGQCVVVNGATHISLLLDTQYNQQYHDAVLKFAHDIGMRTSVDVFNN